LHCEICIKDLQKVLDLAKMYKVLKKYGNSKFSHLVIPILLFTADESSADVFCFVFHE